ncbi:MAG TPA: YaeQ family protein [Terriglobia bacterium]|nr:YaeQ family protein [Terriglobia bacterium]
MALTATIYNLCIDLADIDRSIYERLELRIARHPSETIEFMMMRVLAYCLEYGEGVVLTEGIVSENEPAVIIRDLTGRITAWIEVGMPDADRLHRGVKLAGRAAVYTHRDARKLLANLSAAGIHRLGEVPVYAFHPDFIQEVSGLLERRSTLALSITERELYVEIGGRTLSTSIVEHRIGQRA